MDLKTKAIEFTRQYVKGDFVSNPVTIQQKLAHIKIFGVTDTMRRCADKLQVKDYAHEIVGFDLCPRTLSEYESPQDIDFQKLPDKYVLKCNHGCGYNIIHTDHNINTTQDREKLARWLNTDFGQIGYELQYCGIERKCFAEEYIGDLSGIKDYKFSCFNGKPVFCQVISERGTSAQHMNYYDTKFNFLDICRLDFKNNAALIDDTPSTFGEMLDYARELAQPFDYVRCDFYEKNGRPYLGEMTFTPGNARMRYAGDPETSLVLGAMLCLSC